MNRRVDIVVIADPQAAPAEESENAPAPTEEHPAERPGDERPREAGEGKGTEPHEAGSAEPTQPPIVDRHDALPRGVPATRSLQRGHGPTPAPETRP